MKIRRKKHGMQAFLEAVHRGFSGRRLVKGRKHNYRAFKKARDRKYGGVSVQKHPNVWQSVPHREAKQHRANKFEPIVFDAVAEYIEMLLEDEDICKKIENYQKKDRKTKEDEIEKEKQELANTRKKIAVLESHIPDAMSAQYPLSLEELTSSIYRYRKLEEIQEGIISQREKEIEEEQLLL